MSINQTQTPLIISENITSIITYYKEDHKLHHETIILHSFMTNKEILNSIQAKFQDVKIKYSELKKEGRSLCQKDNGDLTILIPNSILTSNQGRFQYNFQSHHENIFGTLTVDLVLENDIFVVKNEQIFTTSIGN